MPPTFDSCGFHLLSQSGITPFHHIWAHIFITNGAHIILHSSADLLLIPFFAVVIVGHGSSFKDDEHLMNPFPGPVTPAETEAFDCREGGRGFFFRVFGTPRISKLNPAVLRLRKCNVSEAAVLPVQSLLLFPPESLRPLDYACVLCWGRKNPIRRGQW